MNNSEIPNHELISAYLDGEVTQEERALVENSPDLLRQVEELKSLSKEIEKIIFNNTDRKESQILSAVNESEKLLFQDSNIAENVLPLQKPARSSALRPSRALIISSVAAALLAFFAIPLFKSGTQDSDSFVTAAVISTDSERSEPQVIEEPEVITETEEVPSSDENDNGADTAAAPFDGESEVATDTSDSTQEEAIEPTEVETIEEKSASLTNEQSVMSSPSPPFATETITTYGVESTGINSLLLADARIETGEGFDSFIIELSVPENVNASSPDQLIPGSYAVELNGEFQISEEETFVLPEEITNYLVVNLTAHGIIWIDEEPGYELTWEPNDEVIEEEGSNLLAFYRGDFEGNLTFIVGMDSVRPFRTSLGSNPPRLIIEIQHKE